MPLMSRKGILAIAAVIDVALNSETRPVSAKALASRHGLPPRHLEPVLQALVHEGILRGVRGPRGGYELGRDRNDITANEILRAAGTVEDAMTSASCRDPIWSAMWCCRRWTRPSGPSPRRWRHQLSELVKQAEKAT